MRHWLVFAGFEFEASGHGYDEFRKVFLIHGYDVFSLVGNSPREWHEGYVDFVESFVGVGAGSNMEPEVRVGLVGKCAAADDFAKSYFDYFRVYPPGALVLVEPTASEFYLNQIACPYLIVSAERRFTAAVNHHRQRYTDMTTQLKEGNPPQLALWLDRAARRARKQAA